MRCVACNKDMKALNGDEYWRTIELEDGEKIRVLEDMCKTCRKQLHTYEKKMAWKVYDSEIDFLEEYDDIISNSESRFTEGRRAPCPNPDEL